MHVIKSIEARQHNWMSRNFQKTKYGKQLAALKDSHKGENCFIVGNGPSLRSTDLQIIHDKSMISFGTNRIYKIFDQTDWRPTYYVSEDILMMRDAQEMINTIPAKKKFFPVNLYWDEDINIDSADYFFMVYYSKKPDPDSFNISTNIADHLVCRGTVTITCLQLAIYMGFSNIYLIGVDHSFAKIIGKDGNIVVDKTIKNHFVPNYEEGISECDRNIIEKGCHIDQMTKGYMDVERLSQKTGAFRVYNATRGGKLEVFERKPLEEVFI